MWKKEYADCLEYIDNYWDKIIFRPSKIPLHRLLSPKTINIKNKNTLAHFLQVPNYYFVPNDNKFKHIFYWDSHFMFRGLMGTKRQWLMKEMVNNFIYLFNQYSLIPNFNMPAGINRSQPPFFTSMILDTYFTPLNKTNPYRKKFYELADKKWLKSAMAVALDEYELVWIDKENVYSHHVENYNLSRYGDRDIGYAHTSELESGWDMTSRFFNRCDQFLPVDLNSYLYKYELDFAKINKMIGNKRGEEYWINKSIIRKEEINKYMWNEQEGFYYDFEYKHKQQSNFNSLAGFTPLWAGIATPQQAEKMLQKLPLFETKYGLTITDQNSLAKPIDLSGVNPFYHPAIEEVTKPKQWDYPNIWSPLEYLTVIGLLKYKHIDTARNIMQNSIKAHADLFRTFRTFFEKINANTGKPSASFHYAGQQGFGWTNAIFYRYIQILDSLDANENIYIEPQTEQPPYELAILH